MAAILRTVFAIAMMLAAPATAREAIALSNGWRFHLGSAPEAAITAGFNDTGWDRVSVPHSWNRMGGTAARDATYLNHHGQGWYRLTFATPPKLGDRRAWLQFDASSIVTDVWLNGVRLGTHKGAFARFRFDATQAMKRAGNNMLVVRADNTTQREPGSPTAEVIPMSGDFPIYGGLYRPVSLVLTAPVHIAMSDFGGPGSYASVDGVDTDRARVKVLTRIENAEARSRPVRIAVTVMDDRGVVVAMVQDKMIVAAGGRGENRVALVIPKPRLWNGVADPYLYRLQVKLSDADGRLLDGVEQPLGIRTFRIDAERGFFLNGRHLSLHGVSRHQDRPGKGWAINDADIDEDYALIRDIGANTVRLAHYQHAERAYANGDRDGLAVWAEIPLVDRSAPWASEVTTPDLAANAEQQLRELIRQNFNHPSIIVWSIANEVNLEAAKGRGASHAGPLLERLQRVVHEEDPSRPAVLADCCGSIPSEARAGLDTVAGITDVIGYNRYFGWYSKDASALAAELERLHALYPKQPISVSEYGAGAALTQHSDDPLGGPVAAFGRPHPEEVQNDVLERSWQQIDRLPFIWASWVWNMFDFSNEQRFEGDLTDTNDKGLVTFDRKTKKDAYFFFKANWSPQPVIRLVGRRFIERPYPVVEIKAYSNLARLRLHMNEADLGETPCSGGICRWSGVRLSHGENRIVASGSGSGGIVSDAIAWRLPGGPGQFHIRAGTLVGATAADGVLWGGDAFVTGGEGHFRDVPSMSRGATPAPVRPVAGTTDQTPYESWRSGHFAYAIPVPNGRYRIVVHFFEPDPTKAPGDRVFDIAVQGQIAARDVDIRKETGAAMQAVTRTLTAAVTDGTLHIAFDPRAGEALVSGIAITPIE